MGSLTINGSTSGQVTIAAPAVAGTNTLTLPAATGTVITTASSAALPVSAISATGTPSASTYLRGDSTWSAVSASGQLIRAPQILTSGTSYTTPSNCTAIFVELWGAGGGGGNGSSVASGGGSGAYCAKYSAVTGSTAYTIAIGAAGAAASTYNTSGSSGGNTTITIGATTYTAGGGGGGSFNSSAAPTFVAGGSGGSATNGDINLTGMSGNAGAYLSASAIQYSGSPYNTTPVNGLTSCGAGGSTIGPLSCPSGGKGCPLNGNNAQAGQFYGAGGGAGNNGFPTSGAAGYQGLIRIWEYT